jgi:hypothetical protein
VTLGRALLEMENFEEAKQELEHVLRVAPENLAAIRGLAEIHHRRDETARSAGSPVTQFEEMTDPAAPAPAASHEEPPPDPPRIKVITQSPPADTVPPLDPALAPLEAFLDAILRARGSAQSLHLS